MRITVREIVAAASYISGYTPEAILGERRHKGLVRVRQAVCHLGVEQGFSRAHVGRVIGLHHTTVMHALDRADWMLNHNHEFFPLLVARIERHLERKAAKPVRVTFSIPDSIAA